MCCCAIKHSMQVTFGYHVFSVNETYSYSVNVINIISERNEPKTKFFMIKLT